jgi:hypothetical protein
MARGLQNARATKDFAGPDRDGSHLRHNRAASPVPAAAAPLGLPQSRGSGQVSCTSGAPLPSHPLRLGSPDYAYAWLMAFQDLVEDIEATEFPATDDGGACAADCCRAVDRSTRLAYRWSPEALPAGQPSAATTERGRTDRFTSTDPSATAGPDREGERKCGGAGRRPGRRLRDAVTVLVPRPRRARRWLPHSPADVSSASPAKTASTDAGLFSPATGP